MTTPQDPGDREQPTPFPSAPPLPEQQPSTPHRDEARPSAFALPLSVVDPAGGVPVGGPPRELRIAYLLWLGVAFLHVVAALLAIFEHDTLVDAMRRTGQGLTEDQMQAAATIGIGVVVFIYLVLAGLFVWFTIKVRAGRSWARVSLMILGPVALFIQLVILSRLGLLVLIGLLVIGGFVMLNLRPSSEFIASRRTA